jgi:hypothetical protein
MMQVPRAENETVEPDTEQMPLLLGSVLKTTAKPELAVAVIVYGGSYLSALGGVDVIVIVCGPRPTAKVCCTCAAW